MQRPRDSWRIYLVECVPLHKSYVGATSRTVEDRFRQHARDENSPLYTDIQRFGEDAFVRRTLELAETLGAAETLERRYIRDLGTHENGYNRSLGGEGLREEATLRGEVKLAAFKNAWFVSLGTHPPVRPFATVDQARAYEEFHRDVGFQLWMEALRTKHPAASDEELVSLLGQDVTRIVRRVTRTLIAIAWGDEPRHPFKDLAVAEEFFLRGASEAVPLEEARGVWRYGCEVRGRDWRTWFETHVDYGEDYLRQRDMKPPGPVEVVRPKAHAPPPAWWPSARKAQAWLVEIDEQLTSEQAEAAERLSHDIGGMSAEAWAAVGRPRVAAFVQMIGDAQSTDQELTTSDERTP